MTAREYEFYQGVRERRLERCERRERQRRIERQRADRLDRIGEALLGPALFVLFYLASFLAFI